MSSDPNQYIHDKMQSSRDERAQQRSRTTLEVVELERQEAELPSWQKRIINVLALLSVPAIIYVIVDLLSS